MFPFILRQVWRLLILLLGAIVLFYLIQIFWPESGSRFAAFIAALIIYMLMAYIVIPNLMNIYRLVIKPNHIPMYATTGDGWPADPVNIAIITRSEKELIKAMEKAGWYTADHATVKNSIKELIAIIFDKPYPTAPFSNLYLFGMPFSVGFQKPANSKMSPRSRHHVRFWRLDSPENSHAEHYSFWHKKLRHLVGKDKIVWIGAAIDDTGPIALRWRNGQITHKNNPDTDAERDLIISDLSNVKLVYTIETLQAGEPFSFRGQTLANKFVCDGKIKVVGLRGPLSAKIRKISKLTKKA